MHCTYLWEIHTKQVQAYYRKMSWTLSHSIFVNMKHIPSLMQTGGTEDVFQLEKC